MKKIKDLSVIKDKEAFDLVDKLVVHLAQSKAYLSTKKLENTLAWRFKEGRATTKDSSYIEWAIKWLEKKPIFLKTLKKAFISKKEYYKNERG
ncbi:MAG: hypothetical protein AABY22_21165 [Nanoarchaeota archaeon]